MSKSPILAALACLTLAAAPALAQADAGTASTPAPAKKAARKGTTRSTDSVTQAQAPSNPGQPNPATQGGTKATAKTKSKKGKKGAQPPAVTAPAPAAPTLTPPTEQATPAPEPVPAGPADDEAPVISHLAVTQALRGKAITLTAHIIDPSGVFQPVVWLRKRGSGDYLPLRMAQSKTTLGDYQVEIDPKLVTVDLEYYLECWDNAGNGPARVGSPENPLPIQLLEPEKPKVVIQQKPEEPKQNITIKQRTGAPPAITHSAVGKATKGEPLEIRARLAGDTGVSNAKVMYRHVGENVPYKELPMGDIGGGDYTATVPASEMTKDIEYYLEAFDEFGNGPGRSGAPNVPYRVSVAEKAAPPPKIIVQQQPQATQAVPTRPQAPQLVKAPFRANPGRALGWLAMAGFVGSTVFAGGEAYGAWQANSTYEHTFQAEGRLVPELHDRAEAYSRRAKIFGIAAAASLVTGITLLLIFPDHPDTMVPAGSGGDVVLSRF